jgi:hypothetical protein
MGHTASMDVVATPAGFEPHYLNMIRQHNIFRTRSVCNRKVGFICSAQKSFIVRISNIIFFNTSNASKAHHWYFPYLSQHRKHSQWSFLQTWVTHIICIGTHITKTMKIYLLCHSTRQHVPPYQRLISLVNDEYLITVEENCLCINVYTSKVIEKTLITFNTLYIRESMFLNFIWGIMQWKSYRFSSES